jgi:hypothetical protein
LEESNIVLAKVRELWRARNGAQELKPNRRPRDVEVSSHAFTDEEIIEERGVSLKDPVNKVLFRLRESLKPFLPRDGKKFDDREVARLWTVIPRCEVAVRKYRARHVEMAKELWGHLVGACNNVAQHARWRTTSARWKTVRRILLKAAADPEPLAALVSQDSWSVIVKGTAMPVRGQNSR